MPQLFRYFSEKNAHAFVDKGEILFRTLSYYRDYEGSGVRGDEYEGTLVHLPSNNGLKAKNAETGQEIALPYRFESTAREDEIFVYCMSTELSQNIAKRFEAEVVVEILEPAKFINLVRSSLALRRLIKANELVHQPVRYYEWHEPPIVDWALPERIAMLKPKIYEWQHEYRFAVPLGDAFRVENVSVNLVPLNVKRATRVKPYPQLTLKLGNLSKLCRIHKL